MDLFIQCELEGSGDVFAVDHPDSPGGGDTGHKDGVPGTAGYSPERVIRSGFKTPSKAQ